MTDYDDDSDGELPSISLSQSSGVKAEFSMPPATELAAQREREAATELELQKLRDAEAEAAAAAADAERRRDDPAELLSSGVSALEVVGGSCKATRQQVEELTAMAALLPARDAAFLAAYARALRDAPSPAAASAITNRVVSGVCAGVIRGAWRAGAGGAGGAGGAAGAVAALLTAPPGPRARRALHALLDHVADARQVDVVIAASRSGLRGAARRLAAHDAARSGARAGADRLAAALLAAAVRHVVDGDEVAEPPAALSAAAAVAARTRWRRLPAPRQLLLLRCSARALAARTARTARTAREGGELLAALAQPLPRAPRGTQLEADQCTGAADLPLRHQVLANVAKLQLLFGLGRAHQVDDSREQIRASTKPEKHGQKRPQLDRDMMLKKELDVPMTKLEMEWVDPGSMLELNMEVGNGVIVPSLELEHDDVSITSHNVKQEPTDAGAGAPTETLDSSKEADNKAEPMTELQHDDVTTKLERETETVAPELKDAERGRGAVEGDVMEVEVEAASPGPGPGPGPGSRGPRLGPPARRSPRLAASLRPTDA